MGARGAWPPTFTLDQEKILHLLTGDRFYTNPSAALREAILNAIDATHRRRRSDPEHVPNIRVLFDRDALTLSVIDNGVGMDRDDISQLFAKVGASAAELEQDGDSVGEFGIGVVSYFMAGDTFELQTRSGQSDPVGLVFSKDMLAGAEAKVVDPTQRTAGTKITIRVRDRDTFGLLVEAYPFWCRDVDGLLARLMPTGESLEQGGALRADHTVDVDHPTWVERVHLGPIADPTGWNNMTGVSTVGVLYRGVFVQEFEVKGLWGIEGSIDVDPKYFKPRLNREGFVEGEFRAEIEGFLRDCHPAILTQMASRLRDAVNEGKLDKWDEKRWASLWLSVPRDDRYVSTLSSWDAVFRTLPAFELARGNQWKPASLEDLKALEGDVFVAPLADERANDVIKAAVRLLRNTGRAVIRGVRRDKSWMKFAPVAYGTTADLILNVFSDELPPLVPVAQRAEQVLDDIARLAPLYTGPPPIDIVRLGSESPPAIRLESRLVINADNPSGAEIVRQALRRNTGAQALVAIAAKHGYKQLSQVAAAVREIASEPEILSPVRRRYIRSKLP